MKSNFVKVPIVRGFEEIRPIYNVTLVMGGFICGGYVRYCASPRYKPDPASDVDIYCTDDEIFNRLKKQFEHDKLEIKNESDVALTYNHPKEGLYFYAPPIQLIKPIREGSIVANGSMQEIIDNFDFSVIRAAIVSPFEALVDEDFLEDEKKKLLRIKNIHCPISSTLRCMKYSRKGYWLRPFEVLKLFIDWEGRDDAYRLKITDYLQKTQVKNSLTKEEVEELEALMRID